MFRRFGCWTVMLASCCGCCVGEIPTFGLWPEVDEQKILAKLKLSPFTIDNICTVEETCMVVKDATIDVMPIGYNPFTKKTSLLIDVEATCVASSNSFELLAPFVCSGVVGGVVSDIGKIEVSSHYLLGMPDYLSRAGFKARDGSGGGGLDLLF